MNLQGEVLWLVGRDAGPLGGLMGGWEVQGLFASEEFAAGLCVDDTWFIGPVVVGVVVPVTTMEWVGCYRPRERDRVGAA